MRRKTAASQMTMALLLLVSPVVATAGRNSAASLTLTWDRAATVSDTLKAVPLFAAPLYLTIENAPDITAVGVSLARIPYEYYRVMLASADALCGWVVPVVPSEPFDGDGTYNATIVFPNPTTRSCITFGAHAVSDSADSATFCAEVHLMDSSGRIDRFPSVRATINTGFVSFCPLIVSHVAPTPYAAPPPISPPGPSLSQHSARRRRALSSDREGDPLTSPRLTVAPNPAKARWLGGA